MAPSSMSPADAGLFELSLYFIQSGEELCHLAELAAEAAGWRDRRRAERDSTDPGYLSRVAACTGESMWSLRDGLRQSGRAFGPAVCGTAEAVPLMDVADGFMRRGQIVLDCLLENLAGIHGGDCGPRQGEFGIGRQMTRAVRACPREGPP